MPKIMSTLEGVSDDGRDEGTTGSVEPLARHRIQSLFLPLDDRPLQSPHFVRTLVHRSNNVAANVLRVGKGSILAWLEP